MAGSATGADAHDPRLLLHVPRRALLQGNAGGSSGSGGNGFNVSHLLIFTALMVGLAFAIVIIGCLCVRYRRWIPSDGINRSSPGGRHPRQEQPVVLQDAKLQQMPILVVMPGNEVSYAHKLCPEADLAAAFPEPIKRSSADGGGDRPNSGSNAGIATGGGSGDGGGATEQPQQQPAGPAAGAEAPPQQPAPEATAAALTPASTPGTAAAGAGSGSQAAWAGTQLPPGRFQRWSGRSAIAQQLHAQRQAARLEGRTSELGAAAQRRTEPEVRIVPAFIEWDISSSEGPILHPPPAVEPPPRQGRAAEVAAAEALILARAASMRAAPRWSMRSAVSRTSSRSQDPSRHGGDASMAGGTANAGAATAVNDGDNVAAEHPAAAAAAAVAAGSSAGDGGSIGGSSVRGGTRGLRASSMGQNNEGSGSGRGRRERPPADADFITRSLFA